MVNDKINQDQLYNLLVSRELSWQSIILDLINTDQLDPWDIDLALLSQRYLEKIRELEESSFYISSKVLLAAAILLRIKSELLIDKYIKSLDEILFGKEKEKEKLPFEFDLNGVSDLMPRTPIPRLKKVTLPELMSALERAMVTENRRIQKEVSARHASKLVSLYVPKKTTNIKEKIREIYDKVISHFHKQQTEKIKFSDISGDNRESKISTFVPLLHLDNQERLSLDQEKHFEEIFISLFKSEGISKEELTKITNIEELREKLGVDKPKINDAAENTKPSENPSH